MFHPQRFHFIAIGGSVMHNLAITLSEHGHHVSGSDDDIQDPSRTRLKNHKLLPNELGWFPEKIDTSMNAIILGMHAKKDNPELIQAQSLGIPIYSFPEFIYNQSADKQRIVICGSHGKTTITAIIVHVLFFHQRKFDYVIGAMQQGMDNSVRLSDAPIIVIEGDEYLSSPVDQTAKFLKYNHHIAVLSGIAWDHANVFPTKEEYTRQFELLADATPKCGTLIYNSEDPVTERIGKVERADVTPIPYKAHEYVVENGVVYLLTAGKDRTPTQIFGAHNMQNIAAAREVLKKIGITNDKFYEALPSFKGPDGRLQKILDKNTTCVYKDFAHAPSKVRATVEALKGLYPKRQLIGCLELHTFSSLNKAFLPEYKSTMSKCDTAIVYYNPEKIKLKGLEKLEDSDIKNAFNDQKLEVFTDSKKIEAHLSSLSWQNQNLLMMSSGNFNGLDMDQLAQKLST